MISKSRLVKYSLRYVALRQILNLQEFVKMLLPPNFMFFQSSLAIPWSTPWRKEKKQKFSIRHGVLHDIFPLASEKGQVGIFRLFFDHPFLLQAGRFLLFGLRPTRCSLAAVRHSKEFYTKNGVWWVFPTALKLVCMNISFISNYNETVFRNVLAIALANPRGVHRLMAVRRA